MTKRRVYSRYTDEASELLGRQIKLGRKERNWSEGELAERLGVSRSTVQKIEKGDKACALGSVLEAAALVGVALFAEDTAGLSRLNERLSDQIALLPSRTYKPARQIDDDF